MLSGPPIYTQWKNNTVSLGCLNLLKVDRTELIIVATNAGQLLVEGSRTSVQHHLLWNSLPVSVCPASGRGKVLLADEDLGNRVAESWSTVTMVSSAVYLTLAPLLHASLTIGCSRRLVSHRTSGTPDLENLLRVAQGHYSRPHLSRCVLSYLHRPAYPLLPVRHLRTQVNNLVRSYHRLHRRLHRWLRPKSRHAHRRSSCRWIRVSTSSFPNPRTSLLTAIIFGHPATFSLPSHASACVKSSPTHVFGELQRLYSTPSITLVV